MQPLAGVSIGRVVDDAQVGEDQGVHSDGYRIIDGLLPQIRAPRLGESVDGDENLRPPLVSEGDGLLQLLAG